MERMNDINVTWGKEAVTRTTNSLLLAIISEFENLTENCFKIMAIVYSKCWNELSKFKL